MRTLIFIPASVVSTLLLAACATAPAQLQGAFADVGVHQAATGQFGGERVRWAGLVTGARQTGDQTCLELAWYPSNASTLRPTIVGFPNQLPHFLACGTAITDRDTYGDGTFVSVVGTIQAPLVYDVDFANCKSSPPFSHRYTAYRGSALIATNEHCFVSLPSVNVAAAYVWNKPSQFSFRGAETPDYATTGRAMSQALQNGSR